MKNTYLGKTGLNVSRVGMGVLPIGPNQRNLSVEEGADIIKYALANGVNFLDTAQYYKTYPYIKEALKGGQHEPVICTKCLDSDYTSMARAIEEARVALDRDVIDIFLMHEVRTGQFKERSGAWRCLNEAKAKGIIKAIGISTHNIDVTEEMAEIDECDVVFPLINYAGLGVRKGFKKGRAEEMASAIEKCHRVGKGIFSMKAFGGGNLTTDYQKALDYVFSKDCIDSVMVGFAAKKEIDDIVNYLEGKMPKDYNPPVSHKKMRVEESDCEGCGRCIKACQSGAVFFNERGLAEVNHDLCVTCGYCAAACPVRAMIMY